MTERLPSPRRPNARQRDSTYQTGQRCSDKRDHLYLRSHEDFDATVKDVRKQFKFMGDMGTYLFLFVVGEEVPSHEEWHTSRAG